MKGNQINLAGFLLEQWGRFPIKELIRFDLGLVGRGEGVKMNLKNMTVTNLGVSFILQAIEGSMLSRRITANVQPCYTKDCTCYLCKVKVWTSVHQEYLVNPSVFFKPSL